MTIDVGARLSGFTVVELIGTGGMGEVYRAQDMKLRRDVAIKLLPRDFVQDREAVYRLEREARVLASLNHPNIATLYGFETADDIQFLVMELVAGETLEQRIDRAPMLPEAVVGVFLQIANGLNAAHASRVIHRDLKPANIKVGRDDQSVKILDFGLARVSAPDTEEMSRRPPTSPGPTGEPPVGPSIKASIPPAEIPSHALRSGGTHAGGMMIGTPGYMSPEQAFGDPIGPPSDVWAFGCCLFEALTGTRAFDGGTLADTVQAVLLGQPHWTAMDSAPPSLRTLTYECLTKEPGQRPSSAEVVRRLVGAQAEILGRDSPGEKLFEMSPDLICVAGLDGYLRRVNPSFERTLGWTAQQLCSQPFVSFVHPEDLPAVLEQVRQLQEGIPVVYYSMRMACRDGGYLRLSWTSYPEAETGLLYAIARLSPENEDLTGM